MSGGAVRPPRRHSRRAALPALVVLLAGACSTDPDGVNLSGRWVGTAELAESYATTLTLTRSGNTISGRIVIEGVLDRPFVGVWDERVRTITWSLFNGCEEWSGLYTVDSGGTAMSGPVVTDLALCAPPGGSSEGTISVFKQ